MIRVENIHKTFGTHHVLKGVSVHIKPGRTRVILGPSGSGKSVMIKHMIGLLRPDSGRVLVEGDDLGAMSSEQLLQLRRKFGMVFQQSALFDSMTVFENVAFPLREHERMSEDEIRDRVFEKLDLVGLREASGKYPAELSGGMKKRVGLARAVILAPSCVLYDEPTTGLDPLTTDSVDRMIMEANQQLQVTSVVISHDVGSALKVADDIAVINEGEIVADCLASELRDSKDPFVQRFLNTWFMKQ